MLSGFNTNFRHRGVLFHVQTEDSGRNNPHVITHLFYGGNIMVSEKVDYAEKLEGADLDDAVRELMESQHKKMLKALSKGAHDTAIAQRLGPEVFPMDGEVKADTDGADTIPPPTEPQLDTQPVAGNEPARPETPKERIARAFGDGVVSQKPLDEVVLDYLVENARKRKHSAK